MGLDTSHDCWHGPYSSFSRFRNALAEVAGFTFHKAEFGGDQPDLDWGSIQQVIGNDLQGEWPHLPIRHDGTPDPLIILLAHSDCDGKLYHRWLAALADRLESLIPALDGDEHTVEKTKQFVAGLRLAHGMGDDVEFM